MAFSKLTSKKLGNAPLNHTPNSVSKTLEYAYTELRMAELAKELGKRKDEKRYRNLSQSYKIIFDASNNSFCPKDKYGNFLPWPEKGRLTEGFGCVESNLFQQVWFVLYDIKGLINLKGGRGNDYS